MLTSGFIEQQKRDLKVYFRMVYRYIDMLKIYFNIIFYNI